MMTVFVFIVLLPSFLRSFAEVKSMTLGIICITVLLFFIRLIDNREFKIQKKQLSIILSIAILLLCNGLYACLKFPQFNFERFISFLVIFLAFYLASCIFANYVWNMSQKHFVGTIKLLFSILLIDCLFVIISFGILGGNKKPLLFTEVSHLSLAMLPFIFYFSYMYRLNGRYLLLNLSPIVFLAMVNSLTLLAGYVMVFVFTLKMRQKIIISFLVFIIVLIMDTDISYYFDRLNFMADYTNLSLNVFLSGWERAYLNFIDTNGIGIGFQQLGYLGAEGYYQGLLNMYGWSTLNIYDGGSTAPKLISELGIIGVLFISFYIWGALKCYKFSKLLTLETNPKFIFYISCYITFFIELFVRGYGYLSIGVLLFILAVTNTNFLSRN